MEYIWGMIIGHFLVSQQKNDNILFSSIQEFGNVWGASTPQQIKSSRALYYFTTSKSSLYKVLSVCVTRMRIGSRTIRF